MSVSVSVCVWLCVCVSLKLSFENMSSFCNECGHLNVCVSVGGGWGEGYVCVLGRVMARAEGLAVYCVAVS